jgi:hypothetical protein
MAEHTRLHLWLNTVIALVAVAASATSGYYNWQTYNLKTESLGFTINATYECPLEFQKVGEIAPEVTGHGLPLSKCEAYKRVYDQPYGSS